MPRTIVDLDTETTGLDPLTHDAWEMAFIVNDHTDPDLNGEWHFIVPVNVATADPRALQIGHYYTAQNRLAGLQHRPFITQVLVLRAAGQALNPDARTEKPGMRTGVVDASEAAWRIATLLSDAIVSGCRPEFDLPFIGKFLRANGQHGCWHYQTLDVAQVTYGRLGLTSADLPYRSDDLAARLGVEPLPPEERHTALGDARWARRWRLHLDALARAEEAAA